MRPLGNERIPGATAHTIPPPTSSLDLFVLLLFGARQVVALEYHPREDVVVTAGRRDGGFNLWGLRKTENALESLAAAAKSGGGGGSRGGGGGEGAGTQAAVHWACSLSVRNGVLRGVCVRRRACHSIPDGRERGGRGGGEGWRQVFRSCAHLSSLGCRVFLWYDRDVIVCDMYLTAPNERGRRRCNATQCNG